LYAMKWLRLDISHSVDVEKHMTHSGGAMQWVLHNFIGTSVTYNGYSELVCDNCNLDFG